MEDLWGPISGFGLCFVVLSLPIAIPLLISYLKAKSRERVQKGLIESIKGRSGEIFPVVYSTARKISNPFSFSKYSGTGILLVKPNLVIFLGRLKSKERIEKRFPAGSWKAGWYGQRFMGTKPEMIEISNNGQRHYFSAEPGMWGFSARKITKKIFPKVVSALSEQPLEVSEAAVPRQSRRSRIENASNWFFIIAVLTFVLLVFQIAVSLKDGISALELISLLLPAAASILFFWFGFEGRKGKVWPFVVGLIIYSFDTLALMLYPLMGLASPSVLGIIVHLVGLVSIGSGLKAALEERRDRSSTGGVSI